MTGVGVLPFGFTRRRVQRLNDLLSCHPMVQDEHAFANAWRRIPRANSFRCDDGCRQRGAERGLGRRLVPRGTHEFGPIAGRGDENEEDGSHETGSKRPRAFMQSVANILR